MKEDHIDTLRQQDTNLRDAIRLEEEALPPMPADLNARLMQRVEEERAKGIAKRKRRIVKPQQKINDGGLSGAGRAEDAQCLSMR